MPAQAVEKALATIEKDETPVLRLSFAKHPNIQSGQFIPRADALSAPELFYPTGSPDKTYMVVCLDLDPPFASFPFAGPVNHWLHSGFRLSASSAEDGGKLETSDPFIVNYFRPGPPPGVGPHRYLFLLYEQPVSFDVKLHAPGKDVGVPTRIRYNLDAWEQKVGLGEVVAANYFKSK
ncbi:phosphatidylethanolamine-binding protein [Xylariales sp. PMI_506]|nr:phosphatidylethanolamine-binding protein [Xylariales sp. PMI_506]